MKARTTVATMRGGIGVRVTTVWWLATGHPGREPRWLMGRVMNW